MASCKPQFCSHCNNRICLLTHEQEFDKGFPECFSTLLDTVKVAPLVTVRSFPVESIANVDWIDELDLSRAYRRLVDVHDGTLALSSISHNLLDVVLRGEGAVAGTVTPIDRGTIERVLKIHAGPIPGVLQHASICSSYHFHA